MSEGIKDVTKLIDSAGKITDDLHYSAEERDAKQIAIHKADMASDNWLSKSIRPLIVLGLFLLNALILVAEWTGNSIPLDTKLTYAGMMVTAISWYFESKKQERVAEKNANANIKMLAMKTKHELKMERRRFKAEKTKQS